MALYVNGERMSDESVEREMERLRPAHDQAFAELAPDEREKQLREWSRETLVERILLFQAARRDPAPVEPEAVERLHEKRRAAAAKEGGGVPNLDAERRKALELEVRVDRLLARIAAPLPQPTEEELRAVYDAEPRRFAIPESVRVSHILKRPTPGTPPSEVRKKLGKILKRLREDGSASFEDMVEKHSECRDRGGDLGFFPRGHMVKEFEDVVFKLKVGALSEVFRSPYGFHIAKVTGRRPGRQLSFEEARPQIARELVEDARRLAVERFLDAERTAATIEER